MVLVHNKKDIKSPKAFVIMHEKVLRVTVKEVMDELSKGNSVLVHCAQGKCVPSPLSAFLFHTIITINND